MVTVPTLQPDVAQSGLPNASLAAPESAYRMADSLGYGAKEESNLGAAAMGATNAAAEITIKAQDMANQVRVQGALNDARQTALNLQFDPEHGYLQQKGQQALQRDSGVPLATEYGQKLQSSVGDIADTLGNDAQKRQFMLSAAPLQQSFQEGVQSHVNQQFQEYSQSVAKGAVELAGNTAALNWQNPDAIDLAVNQAKTGVLSMMQGKPADPNIPGDQGGQGGTGASANATMNAMKMAESSIRTKVIDSALENNNPTYAMSYFNKYKSVLTADDLLKVQGKLNVQVDQHVALDAVSSTTKDNLHLLAPTTADRAFNLANGGVQGAFKVAMGTESNGQQFAADGVTPLTSSKGATGVAQVMPTTGPEAAQLAGLPWNENKFKTDKNYNYQLGLAYFNKQVTTFGGTDKAFAAYNAGPGALQKALDQSKTDGRPTQWLSYLPKETQDYVTKNVAQLQQGGGSPIPPTKADFVTAALSPDRIGTDPRPQVVNLIREQAEKQYDLMLSSRKEQGESAVQQVQQALDTNGGDMSKVSPDLISNVTQYAPDKLGDMYKYAKTISAPAMATNATEYANAVTYPDKLATMSDGDFATYLKTNFAPGRDQDHIAMVRADALSGTGKSNNSSSSLNSGALKTTLDNRLNSIGIAPTPRAGSDDAQQVAIIRKFVADDIYSQQQQLGRKMSPEEISKRVDTLFTHSATTNGWFQGTPASMLAMKPTNIADNDMTQITAALKKQGVTSPTDEQVMRTYWNWKK